MMILDFNYNNNNNNNKLFIRTYQYGLIEHISYKSELLLIMSNVTIQERKYNLKKANIHTDKVNNNLINRSVDNQLFQLCSSKYPTEIIVTHATKVMQNRSIM